LDHIGIRMPSLNKPTYRTSQTHGQDARSRETTNLMELSHQEVIQGFAKRLIKQGAGTQLGHGTVIRRSDAFNWPVTIPRTCVSHVRSLTIKHARDAPCRHQRAPGICRESLGGEGGAQVLSWKDLATVDIVRNL